MIAQMAHLGGEGVVVGGVDRLVVGNETCLDLPTRDQAVVQKNRDAIPPGLQIHRSQQFGQQSAGQDVEDEHAERRHHDRGADRSFNVRAPTV